MYLETEFEFSCEIWRFYLSGKVVTGDFAGKYEKLRVSNEKNLSI